MRSELEQEFYDTFGIEKIENLNYTEKGFIEHTYNYPEITAEKLLQMVCIMNENELYGLPNDYNFAMQQILHNCIFFVKCGCDCASETEEGVQNFKQQIQQLFKKDNQ